MSMFPYLKEYNMKDMRQMLANEKRDPKQCSTPLTNKLCVITGATNGVGKAAAQRLHSFGADILMINRNPESSKALKEELLQRASSYSGSVDYIIADLSSLEQTARAINELKKLERSIDILINNAGVHMTHRKVTPEGFETVWALNHLSSFLITRELIPLMAEKGKILQVNSQGHRFFGLNLKDLNWKKRPYLGIRAYGAAKTAQLLCTWEFADQLKDSTVTINAMHPGSVKTNVGQNNGAFYRWYFRHFVAKGLRDVSLSAQAIHYLVASEEMDGVSSQFFNLTQPEKPAPHALDRELGKRVWQKSCELTDPFMNLPQRI